MKIIGEGLYPEEKRVRVIWVIEGKAGTPIRIQHGNVRAELPANIALFLRDESGYDVTILGDYTEAGSADTTLIEDSAFLEGMHAPTPPVPESEAHAPGEEQSEGGGEQAEQLAPTEQETGDDAQSSSAA